MLRTVVLFSLLLGLILRGKILRLSDVRLGRLGFIIASFVFKFILVFLSGKLEPSFIVTFFGALIVYGLLLYGLVDNLKLPGFPILSLGIFLNFVVIIFNGGRMPVDAALLDPVIHGPQLAGLAPSLIHKPLLPGDRVWFLADIFALRFFSKIPTTFSVGDVLMAIGISWFILHVMLKGFPHSSKDVKMNF